jgi:hypothetical protein
MKPPTQIFFASLASLAENKFRPSDYSGRDSKVISMNEATNPVIFSVLCVFSGKITKFNQNDCVFSGKII